LTEEEPAPHPNGRQDHHSHANPDQYARSDHRQVFTFHRLAPSSEYPTVI
jgi:hypothetical protein